MHVKYEWFAYTIYVDLSLHYDFFIFTTWNYVNRSKLWDWLRNLQNRFVSEINSDILDIPDLGSISKNEKTKEVSMKIIYGKFGHWEYNYKNNLASLKQGASIAQKVCIWYWPIFHWVAQTLIFGY